MRTIPPKKGASDDAYHPVKRILFVPDTHRPFHSKAGFKLFMKAARRFSPHIVVVLGDWLDNYSCSEHTKDPSRLLSLQDEIDDANAGLDDLDTLPGKKYFVEGNHEWRMPRFLAKHAAALYSMRDLKIPKMLRLKERGWHFTPYKESLQLGRLRITHDIERCGRNAVRDARREFEGNCVIGHVHSMETFYLANLKGEARVGASFGWLGDTEQIDYRHKDKARKYYQLGFGIGFMTENGNVHLQACPIVNGEVVVAGDRVRA